MNLTEYSDSDGTFALNPLVFCARYSGLKHSVASRQRPLEYQSGLKP